MSTVLTIIGALCTGYVSLGILDAVLTYIGKKSMRKHLEFFVPTTKTESEPDKYCWDCIHYYKVFDGEDAICLHSKRTFDDDDDVEYLVDKNKQKRIPTLIDKHFLCYTERKDLSMSSCGRKAKFFKSKENK